MWAVFEDPSFFTSGKAALTPRAYLLGGGAERGGGGGAKGGGGGEGTRLGISVAPTLAMVWFGVTLYADPYEAIILPWAL